MNSLTTFETENYTNVSVNESNISIADIGNQTLPQDLSPGPNFSVIIVYSALFVIAAVGNLTVFISLFRSRHRKSRISLMIRHLAIADLIVTFVMIPLEVGWRLTGRWIAGNVACKILFFLRAFGPYLSSNVLVCVSLDRYFAVLHPLKVNDARRRGKVMLAVAWGASFVYCIPQSFVFRVMAHPENPHYLQCVSFGFFSSPSLEIAYNLMCVMFMYFIPLFVIIGAYTAIMCEISRNSKPAGETYRSSSGRMRLRRSDISNIERARSRTLKMTIMIVAVYIWCCTPYVIITLWYMFDRDSAQSLPEWLQETFFMMVVSNSCMNPIVYGSYAIGCRQNCRCLACFKSRARNMNNGDLPMARRQNGAIAMGVLQCFLRIKQAGSGATRSTGVVNAITRTATIKSSLKLGDTSYKKGKPNTCDRPPSIGKVSFSESSSSHHKYSFHSEPLANTYSLLEQQTLGLITGGYTSSEPNMSPKYDFGVSMNLNKKEVYYHRGSSERTRNI